MAVKWAALLAAIICPAGLQTALAQTKPYEPALAIVTPVTAEPSLAALLKQLSQAAAASNVAAIEPALAADFQVITCKPDALAPCHPGAPGVKLSDAKLPPAKRLDAGLCCAGVPAEEITPELRAETVSGIIGGALESGQLSTHETPGLVCTPSWPVYDRAKAAATVLAAGASSDLLRYASRDIPVHEKPAAHAPLAMTLKQGALVPMLADVATQMPDGWNALALPDGRIGYTDQLGLEELAPSGVCFRKDNGQWKIALVITLE